MRDKIDAGKRVVYKTTDNIIRMGTVIEDYGDCTFIQEDTEGDCRCSLVRNAKEDMQRE